MTLLQKGCVVLNLSMYNTYFNLKSRSQINHILNYMYFNDTFTKKILLNLSMYNTSFKLRSLVCGEGGWGDNQTRGFLNRTVLIVRIDRF